MSHNETESNAEFAALSASALAAIVSIYVSPGPYDEIGVVISITLLIVAYAFTSLQKRTAFQSVAFGLVGGLMLLPAAGFCLETFLISLDCKEVPSCDLNYSRVPKIWVAYSWAVAALGLILLDWILKKRKTA